MKKVNLANVARAIYRLYSENDYAIEQARATIEAESENLPSGSGLDRGVKLSIEESRPEKLVFVAPFHHMDENGYYDGWTDHKIIVTPSLMWGHSIRITGQNKNQIKDYLSDLFAEVFE